MFTAIISIQPAKLFEPIYWNKWSGPLRNSDKNNKSATLKTSMPVEHFAIAYFESRDIDTKI